jgi:hypothetical protein
VIVGLSGYGRTGKGEVGKVLVKNFDFKEIAFADTLRDFLYQQNPWVSNNEGTRHGRLRDIIDTIGWERYKNCMYSKDLRELIQRTGTEAGRGVIGDNVWVNATMNRMCALRMRLTLSENAAVRFGESIAQASARSMTTGLRLP